jgi:hypothetical protein
MALETSTIGGCSDLPAVPRRHESLALALTVPLNGHCQPMSSEGEQIDRHCGGIACPLSCKMSWERLKFASG